jgi:hypothetical protein
MKAIHFSVGFCLNDTTSVPKQKLQKVSLDRTLGKKTPVEGVLISPEYH